MSPAKFYGGTCDVQHPVCRKTQRMIPRNNQGKTDVAAKNLIPEVCPFKKVAARTGRRHRRESFSFAYVCGFSRGLQHIAPLRERLGEGESTYIINEALPFLLPLEDFNADV